MKEKLKSIVVFRTYDTRRNLPHKSSRRRGEALFMAAFLRSFVAAAGPSRIVGRQFAVPDCGVADCIVVQKRDISPCCSEASHLTAFELKLSDWKRALAQAYRYRYYADESVVLLPAHAAGPALKNRHLFERLGVALWTFDPDSGEIRRLVSLGKTAPLSGRKRDQALIRLEPVFLQFGKLRE